MTLGRLTARMTDMTGGRDPDLSDQGPEDLRSDSKKKSSGAIMTTTRAHSVICDYMNYYAGPRD